MLGKAERLTAFLFGQTREPMYLDVTEGKVFPFENCYVPKIFRKPLIYSKNGEIKGWGFGRSAIVNYRGKWYDIEGIKPTGKEWVPGLPEGGDTKEEAENELNVGALFYDYGLKNNIPALMKPVCLFEYSKIMFNGKPLYAPVLNTKGDYRLDDLLGHFLEVAKKTFERLKDDPNKCKKISEITQRIKEELTNKIGHWTGFWYRCLMENNVLWSTNYEKNPDGVYVANSNIGNNNLTAYRLGDGVAIGINDLNGHIIPDQKRRDLEIDRIKKRLSIWEGALILLKLGTSPVNISQYQVLQVYASRFYKKLTPLKGINIFIERQGYDPFEKSNLPNLNEFDIIKSFESGMRGKKPELIEEKSITRIDDTFFV